MCYSTVTDQPLRRLLGSSAPSLAETGSISWSLQEQLENAMPGRTLHETLDPNDLVCNGQVNELVVPRCLVSAGGLLMGVALYELFLCINAHSHCVLQTESK